MDKIIKTLDKRTNKFAEHRLIIYKDKIKFVDGFVVSDGTFKSHNSKLGLVVKSKGSNYTYYELDGKMIKKIIKILEKADGKDVELIKKHDVNIKLSRGYWDDWKNYYKKEYDFLHDVLVKEILELKYINTVFDLGCGDGSLLKKINNKFKKIKTLGIDFNEENIRKAKSKGLKVIKKNIKKIKINRKYDLIICCGLLNYPNFSKKETIKILKKIYKNSKYAVFCGKTSFLFDSKDLDNIGFKFIKKSLPGYLFVKDYRRIAAQFYIVKNLIKKKKKTKSRIEVPC